MNEVHKLKVLLNTISDKFTEDELDDISSQLTFIDEKMDELESEIHQIEEDYESLENQYEATQTIFMNDVVDAIKNQYAKTFSGDLVVNFGCIHDNPATIFLKNMLD